jgi:hypothetical protein
MMKKSLAALVVVLIAGGMAAVQVSGQPAGGTVRSITLPDIRIDLAPGDGRIKVETRCAVCHSVDYLPMQPPLSKDQWTATVNKMIKVFGAPIAAEDVDPIIAYLSAAYGTAR